MSDSFEDYPPARAFTDMMTTADINEAIRIRHTDPEPNIAWMQSRIAELEASMTYWREATRHMLQVKGGCGCLGRAEKLWCERCKIMDKYEQETGNKCR